MTESGMRWHIREKHHRLPADAYRGFIVVAFTANIRDRIHFFTKQDRFTQCKKILLDSLKQFDCCAEVFLFMPNHIHFVLRGETKSSDVLRAMRQFKQRSGYWLSQNHSPVRWQKDFYDHIIRSEAELPNHIWYILNNPVKAGLVNDWKEYPFKGSTVYNLEELVF